MSTIQLPDPHPGRCKNYRVVGDQHLRCLDYEAVEHVCTFPKPRPQLSAAFWSLFAQSRAAGRAEPWVKPSASGSK